MGYGKVFGSLWKGSMQGKPDLQLVFVWMLSNCDALGVIDVVPETIAFETGLPLPTVLSAIVSLEGPDARSRSPLADGARIERLDDHRDWGWRIVNHPYYSRAKDLEDRRRQVRESTAKWRHGKRVPMPVNTVNNGEHGEHTQIQAQIHTQTRKDLAGKPTETGFEDFYKAYPRRVKRVNAEKAWKKQGLSQEDLDRVMAGLKLWMNREWAGKEMQFIPHPASWLNSRAWEDDPPALGIVASPGKENRSKGSPGSHKYLEKLDRWRQEAEKERADG